MATKQEETTKLRMFCIGQATELALKAFPHPTINDVIVNAKKLEAYITPEVVEVNVEE